MKEWKNEAPNSGWRSARNRLRRRRWWRWYFVGHRARCSNRNGKIKTHRRIQSVTFDSIALALAEATAWQARSFGLLGPPIDVARGPAAPFWRPLQLATRSRTLSTSSFLVQRFQCGLGHGGHRDSVAKCVEHFDRVAVLAVWRTVMINNLHHITAAESVFGNVASKSSVSIKFEAHGLSFLRD